MREAWASLPFGELYAEASRNGVSVPKAQRGAGSPMVNMRELFANDIISDQATELVPIPPESLAKWRLRDGDLLFGRRSLTLEGAGKCSIVVTPSHAIVFESSLIRVRLDSDRACPRFFFYLFKSRLGRILIETIVEQVAVAGIRSSDLARLQVPVPPIKEQRRIASVLGALDDLIDTNRRIVDDIARQSRLAFVQCSRTAMGSVALGAVARVNEQKALVGTGALRYLDIASLGDGAIEWPQPIDWSAAPSRARRLAKSGDTLWSTVRPNRRAHALLVEAPEDLVVSTGIAVLTPTLIGPAYLYAATDDQAFVDQLVSRADGSAYPAVRGDAFEAATIPQPPADELERFEKAMWPLWRAAADLESEARTAARTRDELLPLLLSGRARVEDVAA